jgi:hypothetical protein
MHNEQKIGSLRALILCKNQRRRNLIQQGLADLKTFEVLRNCVSPADAHARLPELACWHLILVAPEYTLDVTKSFLESCRSTDYASNAVQILLLDAGIESESDPREELNVDGYLVAPYTLDTFANLVTLTEKLYLQKIKGSAQAYEKPGQDKTQRRAGYDGASMRLKRKFEQSTPVEETHDKKNINDFSGSSLPD